MYPSDPLEDEQTPEDDIARLCDFLRIPVARLYEVAETFRNPDVWTRKGEQWVIEDFLIADWDWNRK